MADIIGFLILGIICIIILPNLWKNVRELEKSVDELEKLDKENQIQHDRFYGRNK